MNSVTGQSIGEVMKPVADGVALQNNCYFPGIVSTSSLLHHPDLRYVATWQPCPRRLQPVTFDQPVTYGSLTVVYRTVTRSVRDSGGDLTGAAHRMPPERCGPVFSDDVVKVAWMYSVCTLLTLILACLRGMHWTLKVGILLLKALVWLRSQKVTVTRITGY